MTRRPSCRGHRLGALALRHRIRLRWPTYADITHMQAACGGGAVLRFLIVIIALALAGLALALWRDYRHFSETPLPGAHADATIDVARGARYRDIVRQLRRERVSRAAPFVLASARSRARRRRPPARGRVRAAAGPHAARAARAGWPQARSCQHRLSRSSTAGRSASCASRWQPTADSCRTMPGASDEEIAHRVGIADGRAEGWFLPETYAWVKGESDFDLLNRAQRGDAESAGHVVGCARQRGETGDAVPGFDPGLDRRKGNRAGERAAADRRGLPAPASKSVCACRPTRP